MRNLLFIALLFASTAAFADNSVATPPSTPPGQSAGNGEGPKMNFDERKAKILAKLHEKEACVTAATTPEALKACMPRMGEHRGQWGNNGEGKGGGFGGGRLNDKGNNSDGAGNSENAPGHQ